MLEALAMWIFFVTLVSWTFKILTFIFNVLLGEAVLMWFAVYTVLVFFNNCAYSVLYAIGATANEALVLFCKPFVAAGVFLSRLGTIILTVLQLPLRGLYYIVVLWLLVYMLNLLYHFVQHRDFTLQGKFYFGPTPHHDHFGQGKQTLTIVPVLLDQCIKECTHLISYNATQKSKIHGCTT